MQSGSTEARLPSSSSPTCAQCRLRVGYVLVALRYLIEIRRERVISQAIVVQVFVEHSANWSEAAAEAFDHDCDYSPNALHAKKKTAFLTVGRQKSQTTAFDANHWKAILQNIRLVWSQVVGPRIVGWRVIGSWIVCRPLASRTIASLPVVSRPIASRPLTSLPPASSWSQVVGSWGRWVPKRCAPLYAEAQMREGCATKAVLCLTHLLSEASQHPAKLK